MTTQVIPTDQITQRAKRWAAQQLTCEPTEAPVTLTGRQVVALIAASYEAGLRAGLRPQG